MINALLTTAGVIVSAGIAALISMYTQRKASALGTRKENRDDFTAINERLTEEVKRVTDRLGAAEAKQAAAEQREHDERRIVTVCLRFIEGITRQLRENGVEPPPLPPELATRAWE